MKQFKLSYERMPKPESELDSARLTVDPDQNRQPTKHDVHMKQDSIASQSNMTLMTVE